MPQTASSRTPDNGAGRRSRGVLSRLAAAPVSGNAVASRGTRFAVWLGGPLLALCCGLAGSGALAQTPGGQIYIAGPSGQNGAEAAQMSSMLDARGHSAATAPAVAGATPLAPTPAPSDDAQSGMITIPGPGERTAGSSQASAPNIVTIPAPGTPATPAALARNGAPALPRVSVGTGANRVVPVVAGSSPAATPNTAADNAALSAANARANVIQRYAAAAAANAKANTAQNSAGAQVPQGQQDGESVHAAALAFLQQQSAGLPGHVTVTVSPAFPRGLAACTQLETFMPPGAQTWGRTTVGVRCVGAKPWTLYVAARVAVDITYYTAARQIEPGQMLSAADLVPRQGDLATLPRTVITDTSQAAGALALLRISAGLPLRTDMLRSASSVVSGQTVKVIAEGTNFTISAEGSALNTAAPGQQVRVRTEGGQIITGVVKDAGTVQVQI
ncbi:flagellar basal body P-ring formation chaperone FlgA [Paraburkholderia dinghuensis]|uniref:Flagellar basal body P-ring formation protein FlgA n=1 Tax=Paraburkholderia dinghuensis TaxID=2305225 RepID=A0A3N6MVQ1_9BURK|nr:flagellar basal body P-ring formation chaperone FlgA [Paraburkholderia dinghuensis]RQH06035.1 flagellar basal body P-ring formation protein FlgA [Paraburkholderia dinghuensis]